MDRPLCMISVLRASFFLRKGCQGFLAYVMSDENDLKKEKNPIVRDFPDVFLDNLPGWSPKRDVKFTIDLIPKIAHISKNPYKMATMELNELKA